MTTVVVPLDGSAFAERAIRPACGIAARFPAGRLLLLTCNPTNVPRAWEHLRDRARLFSGVIDVDIDVVEGPEPADAIVRAVASRAAAVLCMASHGRGGLRAAVLGSVAEEVVCAYEGPVVLVGPTCHTALLPGEAGRMVVCSDGSTFSDGVIPVASAWATDLGLQPWLVEVVSPDEIPAPPEQPVRNREEEAALQRLERLGARVEDPELSPQIEVLHGPSASRSIADFATRLPASLIAMATHGRAGLARTALGSVATEVVRRAPCPVLAVRPSTQEAGA
jgi:nucleotide-binding universal stress UspA family protein